MTKLTKEKLKPAFKTSHAKLRDFFEQHPGWARFLHQEVEFTTYEMLRAEFTEWQKLNIKKKTGRPTGSSDQKPRKKEGYLGNKNRVNK